MKENKIEYNQPEGFSFAIGITGGEQNLIVSSRDNNVSMVKTNYQFWNAMANIKSSNNYDDGYFMQIVNMKEDAVPGILEIIRDHPDPIVHALDLIFPDMVQYDGNVSLEDVCKLWTITLLTLGNY